MDDYDKQLYQYIKKNPDCTNKQLFQIKCCPKVTRKHLQYLQKLGKITITKHYQGQGNYINKYKTNNKLKCILPCKLS